MSARQRWGLGVYSLWRRELVRFVRQPSRVAGALGTPFVFWLLMGSGLRDSFRSGPAAAPDQNYLQYAFPGSVALIVLFTAIFSMISIIEDRREGFLQAVLASPLPRAAIVVGKVLGSTTLAVGQSLVFLVLAPMAGVPLTAVSIVLTTGMLVLVGLKLSALGFWFAWRMESTQGFHAVMNLVLMPMWVLSGALFPASGASDWLAWIMWVNPLTYGVAGLRYALRLVGSRSELAAPSLLTSICVTLALTVTFVVLAARAAEKR